ncbi:MAG: hypothetical protein CL946_03125 [Ectothiorhodospiraceae bacterium]|nr:hypothetical protein [Ectothiorhodospiraceae bacterium]
MGRYLTSFILLLLVFASPLRGQNSWIQIGPSGKYTSVADAWNGIGYAGTALGGDLYKLINDGNQYSLISWLQTSYINSLFFENGYLFLGSDQGGIHRSTNGAVTWTYTNLNASSYFLDFEKAPNGTMYALNFRDGVWASTNRGDSWTFKGGGGFNPIRYDLAIDAANVLYQATDTGLFRSTDHGNNWVNLDPSLAAYSVSIIPNQTIFLGTLNRGFLRSTDNGNTWVNLRNGLFDTVITSFAYSPINGHLYVGTRREGVFLSTDNGSNWSRINSGMGSITINELSVNTNGYLFAATPNGLYRTVSTIPVEFSSFSATAEARTVHLHWQTATETENYGFEVQRKGGHGWETIAFQSGAGTSTQAHEYDYADRNLAPGYYSYRLRQIDYDGTSSYTHEVHVQIGAASSPELHSVYPQPTASRDDLHVRFSLPYQQAATFEVYDLLGRLRYKSDAMMYDAGLQQFALPAGMLGSGTYILALQHEHGRLMERIVVQ